MIVSNPDHCLHFCLAQPAENSGPMSSRQRYDIDTSCRCRRGFCPTFPACPTGSQYLLDAPVTQDTRHVRHTQQLHWNFSVTPDINMFLIIKGVFLVILKMYVVCTQHNCLDETALVSTHGIHLLDRILKIYPYNFLIMLLNITKTYLYNFDPLKPHFYIVKLGFTGVYFIFLISA